MPFHRCTSSGPCGMLCYVDDLLPIILKEEDINLLFDQIGKSVTLKKTGLAGTSVKGGNLRFLGRVISRQLGESSPGVLFSDSESSLKLLRNMDVPRRSRHLEIRIEWLKGRVEDNKLILEGFADKMFGICCFWLSQGFPRL